MRLRQIEVFHAVYLSGSMTNAAALLNVSQPSVSKVLAHAEQQLGYPLFERQKGKLIATPEAHRLFKHAADVYRNVDRLRHVSSNLRRANAGRIRIAGTPAFGVELLPRAVSSFCEHHPDVVFEIETLHLEEIESALIESRVDLGVAFDPVAGPGVASEAIAKSRFVVLAPAESDFRHGEAVRLADLAGHRFIALNNRGPLGRLLSTKLETSDVELNVVAWTETYHVAKALVSFGAGISIADEITARSMTGRRIKIMPLEPALEFTIRVLRLNDAPLSMTANNFVDHLRQSIAGFLEQPL